MGRTFYIIDGSSLMHRAFYALPLLTAPGGIHTNAVYGFTTMLLGLLAERKPDIVAVAFDKSRITFRTGLYQEYKAHRQKTPSELSEQFSLMKEMLSALGIPNVEMDGYEADDIIGTWAKQAAAQSDRVYIVTGDRDALQLIDANISVLLTKKGLSDLQEYDTGRFAAEYGVSPLQHIDVKGLMGDSSDNIPGVAGIGEKTALKMIQAFGSVENVLANIDKISGKKTQATLREESELARLSKQLATIHCEVPVELPRSGGVSLTDEKKLNELRQLFKKLDFKKMEQRMEALQLISFQATATTPVSEEILLYETDATEVLAKARATKEMYLVAAYTRKIPELKFANLVVVADDLLSCITPEDKAWPELLRCLADATISKVVHDAKRFYAASILEQVAVEGVCFDIMLAAYLLNPSGGKYDLATLQRKYLSGSEEEELSAAQKGHVCKALYPLLQAELKMNGMATLHTEVELPLSQVLAEMECCGIGVDSEAIKRMTQELSLRLDELQQQIYLFAGEEFNVHSPKQLGQILFEKLQLPVGKKTKTGYSTDAEVLEGLRDKHPMVDHLLEYRVLAKLKSTYLDGLLSLVDPRTKRVHTTFNQCATATGRLSSSEPNLQNIPVRTEIGRRIRQMFIPQDDFTLLMAADYSQIELRVLAEMSDDRNMQDAFLKGQDIHARTAAEVFEVPLLEVTSEMRSRAKAVNFGIVYGISDYGLSRDIGVMRKEAALYIENYFAKYKGVKEYVDELIQAAKRDGYVSTAFGRKRYLPEINSSNFNLRSFAERMAMNTPIQGTAADIIKKAMIEVQKRIKAAGLRSRMLLQVHDELVFEVVPEEKIQVETLVKETMETCVSFRIPLMVQVSSGKDWASAK
ncbi:DNA polymerase I [Azotosporobacter soli]|uniref:DNA polymerase I n=1 Tax=Azotosporobacter soli TaxID=3055040 RepID=UPI0031FF16F6